jgi:hypothetical protein
VGTENLNPDVVVMESAEDGERCDASGPLNRSAAFSASKANFAAANRKCPPCANSGKSDAPSARSHRPVNKC